MPRRLVISLLAALGLLMALTIPAYGKEGAVTKFDSLPTDWHAGQIYNLGYLIKMDGVEPYKADRTEIIASSLDGKTNLTFPGIGDATPGHYTAQVTFPAVGTYRWKVTQGTFFAAVDLGTISVLPALASTATSGAPAAVASDPVHDSIPLLAVGAALFTALVLARAQRRRFVRTA